MSTRLGVLGTVLMMSIVAGTAASAAVAASSDITTVAGDARRPKPALEIGMNALGVAQRDGRTYIADYDQNVIWEVESGGARLLAGSGERCQPVTASCGDGGHADAATVSGPSGLAFDAAGNLFVIDFLTGRIRRIAAVAGRVGPGSTIVTVGGKGILDSTGDGGVATDAAMYPADIAFGPDGNLYVAEQFESVVRRIVAGADGIVGPGDTIELVVGTHAACAPAGMTDANCLGPGFTAGAARLWEPSGITFDADGNLYIADERLFAVLRVNTPVSTSSPISRVAGDNTAVKCDNDGGCGDGGTATLAKFGTLSAVGDGPTALTVLPGSPLRVAVADEAADRVRVFEPGGNISTFAGGSCVDSLTASCGDGGPVGNALFFSPQGLALDADGSLLVADYRVRRLGATTVTTAAGTGVNVISCVPYAACGDGGGALDARFGSIRDIAFAPSGHVFVADGSTRVRRIDPGGTITTIAGGSDACPSSTAACGDGGPATDARFNSLSSLVVDGSGALYLADAIASRVRRIAAVDGVAGATSTITTVAGSGEACAGAMDACGDGGPAGDAQIGAPQGLSVNASGDLYIVEGLRTRVRRVVAGADGSVSATSTIETVLGTGAFCFSPDPCGDGGPGTAATLSTVTDTAVTASGDLIAFDGSGARLRILPAASGRATGAATVQTLNSAPGECANATAPCGDGGLLRGAAFLGGPLNALSTDPGGGLYTLEASHHRVRRVLGTDGTVSADSAITRLAGDGNPCAATGAPTAICGDGGPAALAQLFAPRGLAVGPAFQTLIADRGKLRQVAPLASPTVLLVARPASGPAPLAVRLGADWRPGEGANPFAAWRLSFGDGSPDQTGSGPPPGPVMHTYAMAAKYTARFTVSDGRSVPATATATIDTDDRTAPTVSEFKATPARFRVGSAATAVAATAVGTTFGFRSTEPGSATLAFERVLPGRRSGSTCRALKRGQKRNCDRFVAAGTLTRTVTSGANSVAFSGRIGRKALTNGRYRVTLIARDSARNASAPASVLIAVSAPSLRVQVRKRSLQTVLRSGGLIVSARCGDPCRLSATAKLGKTTIARGRRSIPGVGQTLLRLSLTKAGARRLRGRRVARLTVGVTAADDAGNRSTASARAVVRRT